MPRVGAGPGVEVGEPGIPVPLTMGKTSTWPFSPVAYIYCGMAQASLDGPQQPEAARGHTWMPELPHAASASKPAKMNNAAGELRRARVGIEPSLGRWMTVGREDGILQLHRKHRKAECTGDVP